MSERPRKIGLFLVFQQNGYQQATALDGEATAARHGVALQVFYAEHLAVQQSRDVVRFMHENAAAQLAVIVVPIVDLDLEGASVTEQPIHALARRVAAKGVAWLVLNRDAAAQVRALRQEFPDLPAAVVNADQKEFGRLQGLQFKALRPQGGHALYVVGSTLVSSARDRRAGMLEEAGPAGFRHRGGRGRLDHGPGTGCRPQWLLRARLRDAWPDLVGCQNDEMALGAREALVQAARDFERPALARLPVTGGDGLPELGRKWVAEGKLTATIVMPPTSGKAVDLLLREWNGGPRMPATSTMPVTSYPELDRLRVRAP